MTLGSTVRGLFGPFEYEVADAYRAIFLDLDACADHIHAWVPHAGTILEVGCGEGAMTERLLRRYPSASITAVDVTPRLGRLFRGDRGRVRFRQMTAEEVAAERPAGFDLAILCDVLHHVPSPARRSLLGAIRTALAPGGSFVFKEWTRSTTPIHWLCSASERYVTGDMVAYLSPPEARDLVNSVFGSASLVWEQQIKPWRNNLAMLVRPSPAAMI